MEQFGDTVIIKKIKKGEINQYVSIVKRHMRYIKKFVSARIANRDDVEDILQTTFIKFYKSLDRFDDTRPVKPYLLEIAKNEIKMFLRAKKEVVSLGESVTVENKHEYTALFDLVSLIQTLSASQQYVLNLIYEGYSYKEIAARLNISVNTIKTTVRRARLKIIDKRQ